MGGPGLIHHQELIECTAVFLRICGCAPLTNQLQFKRSGGSWRMTAFGYRKQNGAMGGLLFCAVLLTILGLGTFALDFSHVLAVRGELQNAADAAALAGAGAFAKLEEESAETHALDVANANTADGRAVSNNSR